MNNENRTFSIIELLKKEISRIEIGNAGFELAKQVLREIDRMVRSEINERNNDENDVRGRHLRDSLAELSTITLSMMTAA